MLYDHIAFAKYRKNIASADIHILNEMNQTKICQSCKKEFTIDETDSVFYERINVPTPTFCSMCRAQRRMAFLTDRAFYKRKCDATGQMIFSHFSPQSLVKVYEHDYWWSDKWDSMIYGKEYDFSIPFFEQFKALMSEVPLSSRSILNLVRSDYCDHADNLKDCYLVFYASYGENLYYSTFLTACKDTVDIDDDTKCELSYRSIFDNGCYRAVGTMNCKDCQDIWFSRDCVGCHDCFGCVNLRNKSFCILNVQYNKVEYQEKLKELALGSFIKFEHAEKQAKYFWGNFPHRYMHGTQNTVVSGEYIYHAKQTKNSYNVIEMENCRYCQLVGQTKDSYDYTNWGHAELMYECSECGIDVRNLKFCFDCWPGSHELEYCIQCHSSSNLFGCIGLRNKKYCIFNKQYTKEEYEALIPKIRAQMNDLPYKDVVGNEYRYGEFFPGEFSPFAYHETKSGIFFPLNENEARAQGYPWHDVPRAEYQSTVGYDQLKDDIADVDDEILKEIISCAHQGVCAHGCRGVFRILPGELQIYRRLGVPLPRECQDCRYMQLIAQRNPIALWKRRCNCAGMNDDGNMYKNSALHFHEGNHCPNEFETSYSPDRPEIVYCEQCYQQEAI